MSSLNSFWISRRL